MTSPKTYPRTERDAFDQQARAVLPVVRAVLAGALGVGINDPDVDDGANEVLRRAWEGRGRLQAGAAMRPWAVGIARHVATDALRRRGRERKRRVFERPREGQEEESAVERVADDRPGVDERLDEFRAKAKVREAMEALAPGPREAMILVHIDGLGYQQVADRMGVPLGTVATWISRGRRAVVAAMRGQQ